jgi:hypothetical protein
VVSPTKDPSVPEEEPLALASEPGIPLVGLLPLHLGQLKLGIDAVFEQIGNLGNDLPGNSWSLPVTGWLMVTAAVAGELLRVQIARSEEQARFARIPDLNGMLKGDEG